jgi:TfoX/Sxy family transcriptional regulator of competence genes
MDARQRTEKMAYDPILAERIRAVLLKRGKFAEKQMFGGICFLTGGKMIGGVVNKDLIARVPPEAMAPLLKEPGTRPFDFSGRPMKGFLYVGPQGVNTDSELAKWLDRSLDYVATLPAKKKK